MLEVFSLGVNNSVSLFTQVRVAFQTIINWTIKLYYAIFSVDGVLYSVRYFFVIGIAISLVFLSIKVVKTVVWGD